LPFWKTQRAVRDSFLDEGALIPAFLALPDLLLHRHLVEHQLQQAQLVFLREELRLKYKDGAVLQPCTQGVDFLGYRVYAHHRLVRPRVVRHCCVRLGQWQQRHSQPEAGAPCQFRPAAGAAGATC
jgi:hypothetical protein